MYVSKKAVFGIASGALLAAGSVSAGQVYDGEKIDITTSTTIIGAVQQGKNVNYGAKDGGGFFTNDSTTNTNVEGSMEVGGTLTWDLGDGASISANASIVGAVQKNDGELSGQFGNGDHEEVSRELFNVGFSNDLFDLSFGAQDFMVGDGFLLGDGNFDTGADDGTYWAAPRTAWSNSAILRLNTDPVRADIFWLKADKNSFASEYAGANVEYALPDNGGTLAAMYFKVTDDDGSGDTAITGSDTILSGNSGAEYFDLRANGIAVPGFENLTFHGEYTQIGGEHDESGLEYDAEAWYAELNYAFNNVPWTPVLSYRYSSFSGDDLASSDNEGFFISNYGIGRDWDTWFQGEITGEAHLFNNNQNTHLVKLKAYPHEQWAVAAYYLNFKLDEKHWYGSPTTSDDWADEINLTVEYYPTDNFYVFGALAWATPGDAAKEMMGDDDALIAEVWFTYTF
jgi:Alginate export